MSGFLPDHAGAEVRISPNFGPRLAIGKPNTIILHYTGMESGEAAESWLCDPRSQVSSHYLVHENGRIVQMVREADRAWHAGKSSWQGETDINSLSIGIEMVNPGAAFGYRAFPDVQIGAVIDLCHGIVTRHRIRPERVLAHSDVAPGRKIDPGELFPWSELAEAGIGHFVAAKGLLAGSSLGAGDKGPAVERLQSMLSLVGYGLEIDGSYDPRTAAVVGAFQLHFRQRMCDGVADPETVATLVDLLQSLPAAEA